MNVLTITMRGIEMSKMSEIADLIDTENVSDLVYMIGIKQAEKYFDRKIYEENEYDD